MVAATLLALSSAVLHASWNLAVKAGEDRPASAWVQMLGGTAVMLPVALASGPPPAAVLPHLAASVVLHVLYALALLQAYQRADLSVAYPVARGSAPLLATAAGVALLGDDLAGPGYAGVGLVTAGLLWVGWRSAPARGLAWAVATGVLISVYTVVDTAGVRTADETLSYVAFLVVGYAGIFSLLLAIRRGPVPLWRAGRRAGGRQLLAGVASVASYFLVLVAVRLAPVGYVATLRESSVVFGALGGWLLLGEGLGRRRVAGAAVTAAGMAVLVAAGAA